ncbi:MAG: MarR family transcriptional regulator [Acidobacteriia bacterium]|nr:MarR family transcriptional regulator [Terriglobia bacterium]
MVNPGIREFRKHLRVIERAVGSLLKEGTSCCEVTLAQCHALLEIAETGETSIVDLSERLGLDTSTLSRTVDSLVKAGYVSREIDPENRRYVQLHLTDAGKGKVEFIDDSCDRFYTDLLARIPKSQRPMLAESVKLLASMLAGTSGASCDPGGCRVPATARKRGNRHGKRE